MQLKSLFIKKILEFSGISKFFWKKFKPEDFKPEDKLFRGFKSSDLDENNLIDTNAIRFPDFSCNWSRFSKAKCVRYRKNASLTDGCFSITTEVSRFNKMATPCHDPLKSERNYAHVEVRQLMKEECINFEPPKNRKLEKEYQGWSKSQKLAYRKYLVLNLKREIEPSD